MPGTASPTFTIPPAGTTTKDGLVPEDLYQRYQEAHRAHHAHCVDCTHCTGRARCSDGERLWSAFEGLQDAYLARQCKTR